MLLPAHRDDHGGAGSHARRPKLPSKHAVLGGLGKFWLVPSVLGPATKGALAWNSLHEPAHLSCPIRRGPAKRWANPSSTRSATRPSKRSFFTAPSTTTSRLWFASFAPRSATTWRSSAARRKAS